MPPAEQPTCLWAGCSTPGAYQNDQALFEHLLSAHKRPSRGVFECHWRGCAFTSANRYTDHIIRHTNYRPHGCTYPGCGKAFSRSFLLTQHIRVHNWFHVSEHACKWVACGAAFAHPAELRKHIEDAHMVTAVDGKRCGWAGCRHTFIGAHFHAHMTGHFPACYQPLVCTRCEKSFKTEPGLKAHIKQVHGVTDDGSSTKPHGAAIVIESSDESDDDPFSGLNPTGGGATTQRKSPGGAIIPQQRPLPPPSGKRSENAASFPGTKRAREGEHGGSVAKRRKLSDGATTQERGVGRDTANTASFSGFKRAGDGENGDRLTKRRKPSQSGGARPSSVSRSRALGEDITNSTRLTAPSGQEPKTGGIARARPEAQTDDDDWVFLT